MLESESRLHAARRGTTPARLAGVRRFVGGFYLVMAGINAGVSLADATTYDGFADPAASELVRRQWHEVVMADPMVWGLLLATGELVLGVLLLRGGPAARVGWAGVVVFHLLLMAFGPWIWVWCLPALAVLVPVARAEWPLLGGAGQSSESRA